MTIAAFRGAYAFLSNFSQTPVVWRDEVWPTAEHAFQAAKCLYEADRVAILNAATPGEAKRLGRKVTLRLDWEEIKDSIMEEILRAKFASANMQSRLLSTKEEELVEGNVWHDNYWGDCRCSTNEACVESGENKLGKLLMKLRGEIRARKDQEATKDVQGRTLESGS